MTVVIINPNSTTTMTEAMVQVAQTAAPDLRFEGWTSHKGPASIQGADDGDAAEPHLLKLVQKASDNGASGVIIGCFDDTGLEQAGRIAKCPVIGIGQAAYHFAALNNWRFSVVTTLPVSIPVLHSNIHTRGLSPYLSQIRASDVPVLALHNDTSSSERRIVDEAKRAAAEDQIDAIILGCAGMVTVTRAVRHAVLTTVIDPVATAATSFNWLFAARTGS